MRLYIVVTPCLGHLFVLNLGLEEIWINFKNIVYESIERFVPHKILRKNSDPEYYNKEIRRLKLKVRKAYNRRKLGYSIQGS